MGKSTSAFHLCRVQKMLSSASALLLCLNCQRYEVQLPHFRSAKTFKGLKLCFRNSALSFLPKIRSSAFHTSTRPRLRRSRSSSAFILPGLPNMGKSTSTFKRSIKRGSTEQMLCVTVGIEINFDAVTVSYRCHVVFTNEKLIHI